MPLLIGTITCREEDIRQRAYEIYLDRMNTGTAGDATQDWLEAERRLRAEVQFARAVEWVGDPKL